MSNTGLLDLIAVRTNTPFERVLEYYDLSPAKPGGPQLKLKCPFHDDRTPSLSVNTDKDIFRCFGCPAKGNVLDFIALMEKFPENPTYQAALKALEITGNDPANFKKEKTPQKAQNGPKGAKRSSGKAPVKKKAEGAPDGVQEDAKFGPKKKANDPIDVTLVLDHDHEFLATRQISPETAEAFGLGHCRTGIMKNRVAVPIHNLAGELVAFTGRWAEEEVPTTAPPTPRYKLPKGFEKSLELYNIHRAADLGKSYVVVVEGIWSAIRLHQEGIPAVALLGTDVSAAQAELLLEAGFKYAILLLDGDEAGRLAAPAAVHVLSQTVYVKTLLLPEGSKPDTMDASIVSRLRR